MKQTKWKAMGERRRGWLEQFSCWCTRMTLDLWPFSLKENSTPRNFPYRSHRRIALAMGTLAAYAMVGSSRGAMGR